MQRGLQAIPPPGVVFDCDLGNDIGDVLALALLHGLDGRNECRFVATTISKPNLKAAALSDVIARFYAGAGSGTFGFGGRGLPVGLAASGPHREDTPMLSVPLARQTAEGKPVYSHGIATLTDTADPLDVFRNALSAQHSQNAIVVAAGPATNLVAALRYPPLRPVIPDKCRLLVIAAGSYPDGKPEPAIQADVAAARQLFAEWPTPIVAVGIEAGEAVRFPAAGIEKEFAWAAAHPVVDAYKAHKPMPYDASASALAAMLYAVRPTDTLYRLSEPGTIAVLDDARTKFSPSPGGKHRYLIVDPAQKERIQRVYVELASAKPVPRAPRRRSPQQQAQPEPPAKPAVNPQQ